MGIRAMQADDAHVTGMSVQVDVNVKLGMDMESCTAGFTGDTLRFGVFGAALDNAMDAASVATDSNMVVTDRVAVHCSYTLSQAGKGFNTVNTSASHRTQPIGSHPRWLWFTNPALERRFLLHHNSICIMPELLWMILGVLSVFAYARPPENAATQPMAVASVTWTVLEAITLAQVMLYRAHFLRCVYSVVLNVLNTCVFITVSAGTVKLGRW